jgi:histidine ammonia-lyase
MGAISARKCRSVVANAESVIAIELLCGCQAVDLLTKGRPGQGTEAAHRACREAVPVLDRDREIGADIERMLELVRSGRVVRDVEAAVGALH